MYDHIQCKHTALRVTVLLARAVCALHPCLHTTSMLSRTIEVAGPATSAHNLCTQTRPHNMGSAIAHMKNVGL